MILDVVKLAIGAGTHIMTNRQKRKMLESDAAMLHAQKMANGEVEYQQTVRQSNDKGWKDEFVLILISLPILLLIWSVFSDDPTIQEKIDVFFDKFANLPFWYQNGMLLNLSKNTSSFCCMFGSSLNTLHINKITGALTSKSTNSSFHPLSFDCLTAA